MKKEEPPRKGNIKGERVYETDVLVIGGGGGARAAIGADKEGARVILVDKGILGKAGITNLSFGIVCAYTPPPDGADVLAEDMVNAGELNNQKLVDIFSDLVASGEILDLEAKYGLVFDRKENGDLVRHKLGGHSYARDLSLTWNNAPTLWRGVLGDLTKRNIKVFEETMITNLLIRDGRCVGALGIDITPAEFIVIRAKSTVLATGGIGQLYKINDNARGSTGDGVAMAYRAGAELRDMEFIQFMMGFAWPPTLRGIGIGEPALLDGKLFNANKERFMKRKFPEKAGNVPKDVHCREVMREIREGRGTEHDGVWFDITKLSETGKPHRDYLYPLASKVGIDLSEEYAEATATEHYHMGGVYINEDQEATTVPCLFAVGECASGLHGIERLGGCSVADITVMGQRAGKMAAKKALGSDMPPIDWDQVSNFKESALTLLKKTPTDSVRPPKIKKKIQDVMWEHAHLLREGKGLKTALTEIKEIREEDLPKMKVDTTSRRWNYDWIEALEVQNMVEVAEMILRSALKRKESRGAHVRLDYPQKDNENWLKNIVIKKEREKMEITTRNPVVTKWDIPKEVK